MKNLADNSYTNDHEEFNDQSLPILKQFFAEVEDLNELMKRAKKADQILIYRLQKLKSSSSLLLNHLRLQQIEALKHYDILLIPAAKDVTNKFLEEGERLKELLDYQIEHHYQANQMDWLSFAEQWRQLFIKLHDRKALKECVLKLISEKIAELIDKDIRLIKDYQSQSLSQFEEESEDFKDLESRLANATDEPLKQLYLLRNETPEHQSLKQATDWVANLQEQRETCFDQLLMKIDGVVKEVVKVEEAKGMSSDSDGEGEVIFMERELKSIQAIIEELHPSEENEIIFLESRLEGVLDHAEELDLRAFSPSLRKRIMHLKDRVIVLLNRLKM